MSGCNAFDDPQMNMLADAITVAAGAEIGKDHLDENKNKIYYLLENTPFASIVVHICDALKSNGCEIVRKS